jgi:hypothetical protein
VPRLHACGHEGVEIEDVLSNRRSICVSQTVCAPAYCMKPLALLVCSSTGVLVFAVVHAETWGSAGCGAYLRIESATCGLRGLPHVSDYGGTR